MILVREAGGNFTVKIGVKGRCVLNSIQSYLLIIILSKQAHIIVLMLLKANELRLEIRTRLKHTRASTLNHENTYRNNVSISDCEDAAMFHLY